MFQSQQFEQQVANEVRMLANGERQAGPARRFNVQQAHLASRKRETGVTNFSTSRVGCLGVLRMFVMQVVRLMQVGSVSGRVAHKDRPQAGSIRFHGKNADPDPSLRSG
jgi:hypothetical protein